MRTRYLFGAFLLLPLLAACNHDPVVPVEPETPRDPARPPAIEAYLGELPTQPPFA
jgi:hypothetical protein